MKLNKLAILIAFTLALSACIEVEDNNDNDAVVAALQDQNQTLNEQNAILNEQNQSARVNIRGLVRHAVDDSIAEQASILVKMGGQLIAEEVTAINGIFQLTDLPSESDLEIVISSPTDAFMPRAFYKNTGASSSGVATKDMGEFYVSQSKDVLITAYHGESSEPVLGLEFFAYSHEGDGSSVEEHKHVSTFDEVNGLYSITVPSFLTSTILSSVDADADGTSDYTVLGNYSALSDPFLYILDRDQDDLSILRYFEIEPEEELPEIEVRVSIVGTDGLPMPEASMVIESFETLDTDSVYNESTMQHVISTEFDGSVSISIPSFTVGNINYRSASIYIRDYDNGEYTIQNSGAASNYSYNVEVSDVLELAIKLDEDNSNSINLEVVTSGDPLANESVYTVFYSLPIIAPESSVSLINTSGFVVLKGNEDENDIFLPGTTLISGDIDVPVTFATSLNDTKLTISPIDNLSPDTTYQYSVDDLEIKSSGLFTDVSGDSVTFTTAAAETEIFDIEDIRLDNNNYTTNGNVIVAQNTANEDSNASDNNDSVYLFFPPSISTLQSFVMRQQIRVRDGDSSISTRDFTLVENGSLSYSVDKAILVSLAQNEDVVTDSIPYSSFYGTNLSNSGSWYRLNSYQYMSDNIEGSENSISYSYVYVTKTGETESGQITLFVE